MARQDVTFEQVDAAANSLHNDGKPVDIDAVCDLLGTRSVSAIHQHLTVWRAGHARPAVPEAVIPDSLLDALGSWVRQYAQETGAGVRDALAQSERDAQALHKAGERLEDERDELLVQTASITSARDQALATAAERGETITRLTAELNDARNVATNALVGKAKDQLAIEGKESQLAALRLQIVRNVAASAGEADARLAAEMELIGAVTARDTFAAEIKELRAQLATCQSERRSLPVEV